MNEEEKPVSDMRLAGINLAVLLFYTAVCAMLTDGILLDAFLIAIHVIACLFAALVMRIWAWLLSGLMVLIVGFSTCVGAAQLQNVKL